jgi:hypothetical protein
MLSVSARLHVLSLSPAISLCACVQADRFQQACDAIVNTVVLIRVKENNFIFGGFTGDAAWSRNFKDKWARSSSSFVFSLVNAVGGPVRLQCTRPEYAIWCHSLCGPAFGCGFDIAIAGSWTRAGGGCYCSPRSYTTCDPAFAVTPVTDSLLAGSRNNWSVGELEVFALEASG